MTTEDDFRKAIDANPGDWQTRLVFADWLADLSDPRAEEERARGQAYQVLARYNLAPWTRHDTPGSYWWSYVNAGRPYGCHLTSLWYALVEAEAPFDRGHYTNPESAIRGAVDAFVKLPADKRSALLR